MKSGIYKITNLINGKIYIGQSVNIHRRWRSERTQSFNPKSVEYNCARARAFRKYGIKNFKFEIIEECVPQNLNEREIYWANYYNSYTPFGYNGALCGNGHGHPTSLENIDIARQIINDLRFTKMTGIEIGNKYKISDQTISDINVGRAWHFVDETYPIRIRTKKQYRCIKCGKPISDSAKMCLECSHKEQQKCKRPSKLELLKEIATSSFVAVGAKHKVTSNAVKKWCKSYGLPIYKKEIKSLYFLKKDEIIK